MSHPLDKIIPQAGLPCTVCKQQTPRILLNEATGVCPSCYMVTNPPKVPAGMAVKTPPQANINRKKKKELDKERAHLELCRRRLLPFIEEFNPGYKAGWVHKDLCARIEKFTQAVERKESPRLMVMFPPRHGKSTIASIGFPAWYLGKYPLHEFIMCSYGTSLATKFSRLTRSMLRDRGYAKLFPETCLDPDSQSVLSWRTTSGGGLLAAGVGSGITGHGAHVLLIDDPVKDRAEAQSNTSRELTWDWYTSTAYTRLAPGGGVMIIQTRWHDDDLSGRLLVQMQGGEDGEDAGDQWEVVKYPAIAPHDEMYRKKGEPLHAERYSLKELMQIKRVMGPRDWAALMQQEPVVDEGAYFNTDMIQYYDTRRFDREHWHYYTAWDLAIGEKEENDYTVGITVGLAPDNKLYIVEERRGHWHAHAIVKNILDSFEKWHPKIIGIERGHIEMAIGPYLREEMKRRDLYSAYVKELKTGRRDKEARARSIQGRLENGMVFFPRNEPWTADLVSELLRFPSGKYDDRVDSMAWIGLMLDELVPVRETKPKKRPGWQDQLAEYNRGDREGGSRSAMSA